MEEFIQHAPGPQTQASGPARPFAMDHMWHEVGRIQNQSPAGWASEFGIPMGEVTSTTGPAIQAPSAQALNPLEFSNYQNVQHGTSLPQSSTNMPSTMPSMGYRPMGYGQMNGAMPSPFGPAYMQQQRQNQQQLQQNNATLDKGKTRAADVDWEAHFASLEKEQSAEAPQLSADDLAESMATMEKELSEFDRSVPGSGDISREFETIWEGIKAETAHTRKLGAEEDLLLDMENWDTLAGVSNNSLIQDPQMGSYTFESESPFDAAQDPYAEGIKILDDGGNLTMAALAFESAVRRQPSHVDAWVQLGTTQAQNENETAAIRALVTALELDEKNTDALLALAVSYTNEGYDSSAYRSLERWVAAKYPTVVTEPLNAGAEVGFTDRYAFHQKVIDLFIKAAQMSPEGEHMDPDVQVGLGVLFYGAEEYEKAVDCFSAALASTEMGSMNQKNKLHLLWNRLGATLANSGKSEEAIEAYEKALEIRPNFVRAIYNLGVSCINIGCHREAAQHILGALAMQQEIVHEGREKAKELLRAATNKEGGDGSGPSITDDDVDHVLRQNQSTNLYDTLRRVLSHLNRRDLIDMVGPGMDLDHFRTEFDF